MTLAYIPPGVNVQELASPSVAPLLALPGSVCLIGMSAGTITRTDTITLSSGNTPTNAAVLPGVPAGATMTSGSIVSVIDVTQPQLAPAGFVVSTDYTFAPSTYTITRLGGGAIPDGDQVYVTYSYTPADYFQPIRLNSMADIQSRFGNAWDSTQTLINSRLSHAAQMAFENGASNVVLQPLYFLSGSTRQQPTNVQAAAAANWATVFSGLLGLEDINIIVPVVGQSDASVTDSVMLQIEEVAQDFIYQMKHTNNIPVEVILGEDSSASNTVAQETTLQSHATTLISRYGGDVTQQMVFVNTSQFSRSNATGSLLIGGQYVAAAIAGMLAARDPQDTLTRQAVGGVLAVTDTRTVAAKNSDAANGMIVVESKGGVVQVRHGITMDLSTVATRELNVVRAKHFIIDSLTSTFETQVIGKIVADADAPTLVNNVVIATLEDLRTLGALSSYDNVESRIVTIDPTAMEVRFSYVPVFVINYISIIFTLDLTNQTITASSAGSTS